MRLVSMGGPDTESGSAAGVVRFDDDLQQRAMSREGVKSEVC